MNLKSACKPIAVFVLLSLFAFLCAAAIAEGEILEAYRWMVYLGVALALAAFALFFVFGYLFSLARVRKKAEKLSSDTDAEEKLCALLQSCRTPAARSAVSLELAGYHLRASRPDRALSILMLIDEKKPIIFDKKLRGSLIARCEKED